VEVRRVEEIHSIVFAMVVYCKDESGKEIPISIISVRAASELFSRTLIQPGMAKVLKSS
jgi:hypothetical protein